MGIAVQREEAKPSGGPQKYASDGPLLPHSARIERIRQEVLATRNSICLDRPYLLRAFGKTAQGRKARKEHPKKTPLYTYIPAEELLILWL